MDQGLEFGRNVSGQVTGVTRWNVTRPPDTEHGSQGRNAADQLSDQLTKQPWYYGEIQFQLAFELLQEHANMGDYIVLRSTELQYFLLWMSYNNRVKRLNITTEVSLPLILDTWRWECMANSWVQKQENNVGFYVQPLSNKDHHKKTSQSRYKLKTQNKSFIFCGFCQTFQAPIHLCPETLLWYNVDYANLLLIKATTREGAERRSHLLHARNSNNIKNAQVFPSKAKMLVSLCNDHNTYWIKKDRLEYIQSQRERFTRMCQEDFENYIKTENFDNCEHDFKKLITEMKVKFWFAARKREFKNIKTQEMEEKIEEIYKIKLRNEITRSELEKRNGVKFSDEQLSQMRDDVKLNEVTRETLKDQMTEMKIEIETERQWQQTILAGANKLAEATKRYVAPGDLMMFDYV